MSLHPDPELRALGLCIHELDTPENCPICSKTDFALTPEETAQARRGLAKFLADVLQRRAACKSR